MWLFFVGDIVLGLGSGFDFGIYCVVFLVYNDWYGWEKILVGLNVYVSGFFKVFKVVIMIFDVFGGWFYDLDGVVLWLLLLYWFFFMGMKYWWIIFFENGLRCRMFWIILFVNDECRMSVIFGLFFFVCLYFLVFILCLFCFFWK